MSWRPRLRTVLVAVNIVVLTMPLAALGLFRIYDTELIRRTESELIAQVSFADAIYRDSLRQNEVEPASIGRRSSYGWPVDPHSGLRPIPPELRLSLDDIRAPARDAQPTTDRASAAEAAAGSRVSNTLQEAQQVTLAGIRLVDTDGIVIGSTRGELGMSLAHREEIERALDGEFVSFARERISDSPVPGLDSISRRTKVRVFVAMPIIYEGHIVGAVVASRTPISLQKAVYDNRWVFGLLFLGLVLGVVVISLLTSVTIARPIRALRDKAQALADPDETLDLGTEPGTQEVSELAHTILTTTRALRDRESYLQTFARDVRHEFKAPLSSLRGAVELLQEHVDTMDEERRTGFLDNLMEDVDRLEALTQDLLELARADVARVTDATCRVDDALERATPAGLAVELDLEDRDDLTVRLPADDLEAIFGNILANVALHGGGRVTITGRAQGDSVVLEFHDQGPGFSPEMLERATEAFVTSARGRGGTGLGMSIVRGFVEAHGGSVSLANRDGAVIRLELPAARADEAGQAQNPPP